MIAVYLLILVALIIYYVMRPTPNKKQECRIAKAGDVNHKSPLIRKINDLSNKSFYFNGENIDIKDYEVFIVEGESMGRCGIHTGNGILVSRSFDEQKISHGTIVIYEIDPNRYVYDHPDAGEPQYGFKVRQFIGKADLNESNDTIYEGIKAIDTDLNNDFFKDLLFEKLEKARRYLNNQIVAVSITYKEGGRKDYSIHSFTELYGVVKYIIPEEYIKNN